ncbi:hypothetical protein AVDCRST_MAG81-1670 [uncultured Synechococcales cyanobacterium]|uniref:Uncharacterized protein n=1 Tax=uncultured Synechococcales cyanobacterium TaxID=1936017 RepID=A0A6J4V600_9CYAN|nr:hypothetical protein AVDCRST_MAG81-1670 [uncultured Synechococcales cyanobacterium]
MNNRCYLLGNHPLLIISLAKGKKAAMACSLPLTIALVWAITVTTTGQSDESSKI